MKRLLLYVNFLLVGLFICCNPRYVQETYYKEVSLQPYLESWIGKTENDVLKKFGMPSSTYTSGYGNKILRYAGEKSYHSNGVVIGNMVFNNVIASQHFIEFYFNQNGRVESFKANLPRKYEPKTRTVRKDNSEAWFYGFMGLLGIGALVGAAMIGM